MPPRCNNVRNLILLLTTKYEQATFRCNYIHTYLHDFGSVIGMLAQLIMFLPYESKVVGICVLASWLGACINLSMFIGCVVPIKQPLPSLGLIGTK